MSLLGLEMGTCGLGSLANALLPSSRCCAKTPREASCLLCRLPPSFCPGRSLSWNALLLQSGLTYRDSAPWSFLQDVFPDS